MDPVESERVDKEVNVGAQDDRGPKAPAMSTANGISGVGKKRKADMMTRD